jgi:hypothetical protein
MRKECNNGRLVARVTKLIQRTNGISARIQINHNQFAAWKRLTRSSVNWNSRFHQRVGRSKCFEVNANLLRRRRNSRLKENVIHQRQHCSHSIFLPFDIAARFAV